MPSCPHCGGPLDTTFGHGLSFCQRCGQMPGVREPRKRHVVEVHTLTATCSRCGRSELFESRRRPVRTVEAYAPCPQGWEWWASGDALLCQGCVARGRALLDELGYVTDTFYENRA